LFLFGAAALISIVLQPTKQVHADSSKFVLTYIRHEFRTTLIHNLYRALRDELIWTNRESLPAPLYFCGERLVRRFAMLFTTNHDIHFLNLGTNQFV
jgi:hypothetical protein